MNIREAVIEDARGMAEVHVKSWQETYENIIEESYLSKLKVDDRYELWKKLILFEAKTNQSTLQKKIK
jgi:hypothetical protein